MVRLEKEIPDAVAFARGLVFGNPLIDQIRARGGVAPERIVEVPPPRVRVRPGPHAASGHHAFCEEARGEASLWVRTLASGSNPTFRTVAHGLTH